MIMLMLFINLLLLSSGAAPAIKQLRRFYCCLHPIWQQTDHVAVRLIVESSINIRFDVSVSIAMMSGAFDVSSSIWPPATSVFGDSGML